MNPEKLVSIALSLYKPNLNFLQQQLASINAQDYPKIELVVWNDDPASELTQESISAWATRFPLRYFQCTKNLGYVKAFERLTQLAQGDYIAYCDQDDVWRSDKISRCVTTLQDEGALLVASDRREIDGAGRILVNSVKQQGNSFASTWETGDDITARAAFNCFAPGLVIVATAAALKAAMPFTEHTGHDKWVVLCASAMGKVAFCNETLVDYRQHGNNATGLFSDITCKQDYYENRVVASCGLVEEFTKRFPQCPCNAEIVAFVTARRKRQPLRILKYRHLAPRVALFESVTAWMPDALFRLVLRCF